MIKAPTPPPCKLYPPALHSILAAAASAASTETSVADEQGSHPTYCKLCISAMLCSLVAAAFAVSVEDALTREPSLLCCWFDGCHTCFCIIAAALRVC